jgi:hypothetical protein
MQMIVDDSLGKRYARSIPLQSPDFLGALGGLCVFLNIVKMYRDEKGVEGG